MKFVFRNIFHIFIVYIIFIEKNHDFIDLLQNSPSLSTDILFSELDSSKFFGNH